MKKLNLKKPNLKKLALLVLLLSAAFLAGRGAAYVKYEKLDTWIVPASGSAGVENWGLGFGQEGTQPTGNASAEELQKYDAQRFLQMCSINFYIMADRRFCQTD